MTESTTPLNDYVDQTTLSTAGAAVLVPLCALVFLGHRRYAMLAVLASACFISTAQRISVFGADFNSLRILIIVGIARVFIRGDTRGIKWRRIDVFVAAYIVVAFSAYVLLHQTLAAAIFRIGEMYTNGGVYFLFRCWLRRSEDLVDFAKSLAILAIPVAFFFAVEWTTGRNSFAVFGGVSAVTILREGRLRCQGPFPHPILAGCFWAGAVPLIVSLCWQQAASGIRWLGIAGAIASLSIIVASSSSTPLLAVAGSILAACFLPLRRRMRAVQLSTVLALIGIHFVKEKPVWHLVSRLNVLGGSTGWHRYYLIDQAVNRVGEWGLMGTRSTAHWGHQLFDVTNQYILEGVRGGLASMLLYTAVLWCAFYCVGRAACQHGVSRRQVILPWCVGCALFGHTLAFIAVTYFGQVPVIFWSTIAAAPAVIPQKRRFSKSSRNQVIVTEAARAMAQDCDSWADCSAQGVKSRRNLPALLYPRGSRSPQLR